MSKQSIIKKILNLLNLKEVIKKALSIIILTLVAVSTVYVYAAFVEPTTTPANSNQDFFQKIEGANNNDNAFDSSSVVANANGSIIERLEQLDDYVDTEIAAIVGYIDTEIGANNDAASMSGSLFAGQQYIADNMPAGAPRGPVVAMSAERSGSLAHSLAADYCYDLSATAEVAMDEDTSTSYTDWRLPTAGEAAVFEGTITDASYIWTATAPDATSGTWIRLRLSDGHWVSSTYNNGNSVRCVR